jgi:hypothetical protein
MPCHLRHRHTFGQPQDLGIEIEVPLRPAIAAVHFQQFPFLDEVADRHRFETERLWLASALGLVAISLQLDQLGKPGDQLRDPSRLVSETAIAPSGWP